MSLFEDHNLPFAVALALMVLLAALQAFGVGDLLGDHDIDHDADGGAGDGLLVLFGIGRVPLMMWLATFLLLFAGLGVGVQELATGLTGSPLYPWLAALIAGGGALAVNGGVARVLARIMPRDETTAVTLDALVGRRAKITIGRAAAGHPARAKVLDQYGQAHNVMVEPHEPQSEMLEGDEVLLVRRESETFYCIALQERRLSPV